MIVIAGRLRARAAEPRDCNKPLGMTPEDILNCIAEEIEEELEGKVIISHRAKRSPKLPIIVTDKERLPNETKDR
ncbi:hypothetical protein LCGC14_1764920 [marine sediment metagenome]|uniref:Uncharacterized protein n=1 Tax=marine sediment metagenome TaxID=412755 RepID=A0A0F9JZN8_9ZZZZ